MIMSFVNTECAIDKNCFRGVLYSESWLSADAVNLSGRIRNQLNYFPPTHENILAALGELYQATISTLRPRIMVQGEPTYLADKARANQIRALLLAGIRAAVLWRQLGGRRWQLFISRRKILETAQQLLEQPAASDAP